MKRLLHYFLTTRKDLRILLLVAVCLYLLIEILLINYPEFFNGGYEIGQFFSKLSMSYISSFIFYFIVVHIKAQKDKENINEWVGHKAYAIITSTHLLVSSFLRLTDKKAKFEDFKKQDLGKLLRSVNRMDTNAPYIVNGEKATWLEWYEYLKNSIQNSISEIFRRYYHLDSDLIRILSRLENCMFFEHWELLYNIEHDETFGMYEIQVLSLLNIVEDLENYCENNLKKYQYRTSTTMGLKRPFYRSYE